MHRHTIFRSPYGSVHITVLAQSFMRTVPGVTRFIFHTPHGTVQGTMGTVPDGRLCAYCDVVQGDYIPDGCCGPVCGDCLDLGIEKGFELVYALRLKRWIRATIGWLSPEEPERPLVIAERVLHDSSLALHISQYLVTVTDGLEFWDLGDVSASAPSGIEYDDTASMPR